MKPFAKENPNRVFAILTAVIAVLAVLCATAALILLFLPDASPDEPDDPATTAEEPPVIDPKNLYLSATPDAGSGYLAKLIFFGESTTAHLARNGGVLSGASARQVWKDNSGTRRLDGRTASGTVNYTPKDGGEAEVISFAEAVGREQPEYLVLSFGLNGLESFYASPETYVSFYNALIRAVREQSPETKIILQTVYPVSASGDFLVDVETLNEHISALNKHLEEIASANRDVRIADTASVLRDSGGKLAEAYNNGDGQHLTNTAYTEILSYLRTHAWND